MTVEPLRIALERILTESCVVGDDPYSDIYLEVLGRIEEIAREALAL